MRDSDANPLHSRYLAAEAYVESTMGRLSLPVIAVAGPEYPRQSRLLSTESNHLVFFAQEHSQC